MLTLLLQSLEENWVQEHAEQDGCGPESHRAARKTRKTYRDRQSHFEEISSHGDSWQGGSARFPRGVQDHAQPDGQSTDLASWGSLLAAEGLQVTTRLSGEGWRGHQNQGPVQRHGPGAPAHPVILSVPGASCPHAVASFLSVTWVRTRMSLGPLSVHQVGIRMWTSLGTLFHPLHVPRPTP